MPQDVHIMFPNWIQNSQRNSRRLPRRLQWKKLLRFSTSSIIFHWHRLSTLRFLATDSPIHRRTQALHALLFFFSHESIWNYCTAPISSSPLWPADAVMVAASNRSIPSSHQAYEQPLVVILLLEKWHQLPVWRRREKRRDEKNGTLSESKVGPGQFSLLAMDVKKIK